MKSIFVTIKNIFWLYKPYLKYGKLFVFLSLVFWLLLVPICQLIGVYMPNAIIEALRNNKPFKEIVIFVIIIQIILMFQPMYEDTFNMFCKNKMLPLIEMKIKRDIYEKAIKTDYKYIDNPEYYHNYTWAVSEYANKAEETQELVNRMSSAVITVISMLTIITVLSPIAVIVTVTGTIVENIMYIVTNFFDVKKDDEIIPFDRRLNYYHRIFYINNYAADLKSTNLKRYLFKEYDKAQESKLNIIKKYAFKMIPWALMGNLTFYIARTFVILNIVYGIYTGSIPTIGAYMTMMLAVEKLKDAMNSMFYYVKDANRLGMYAKKIRAFFEVESKIEIELQNPKKLPQGPFEIKFNDVCFKYANSSFAVSNFNLEINDGEKIAIVGENGAGKSTLVKLLLRLYDVTRGSIVINGTDIREYDVKALRQKVGVAFQNSNVYAMSFADNIQLYDKVDKKNFRLFPKK